MVISDLAAHMAGAHGYFETSPYGHYSFPLEKAARVLDIRPGHDYSRKTTVEKRYVTKGETVISTSMNMDKGTPIFKSDQLEVFKDNKGINFNILQKKPVYEGVVAIGQVGMNYDVRIEDVTFLDVESSLKNL